jgi:hypothetical protein
MYRFCWFEAAAAIFVSEPTLVCILAVHNVDSTLHM